MISGFATTTIGSSKETEELGVSTAESLMRCKMLDMLDKHVWRQLGPCLYSFLTCMNSFATQLCVQHEKMQLGMGAKGREATPAGLQAYFQTLPDSMFTAFRCFTGECVPRFKWQGINEFLTSQKLLDGSHIRGERLFQDMGTYESVHCHDCFSTSSHLPLTA